MWRCLCVVLMASLFFAVDARAEIAWPGADWETASPESQGVDATTLEQAKAWLETHHSKSGLVIRRGRIVAEWYFGEAGKKSQFAAYSTSKSLASMATGIAIAEGKLSLEDPVAKYIPDVHPLAKRAVTIKQLLSMTSGTRNNKEITQKEDLFTYAVQKAEMDFKPGEKWDYNNTGLALLSPLFRQATGKEIDEFLNQRVFIPIGITADDWKWEYREGHALPYTGWNTTGRSMARIGLLVLNHGKWKNKQLVPADWLATSIAPSQELNGSYGYLWWNNTTNKWPGVPADAYAALGKWDNDILIVPSLDLIVVRQSDLAPPKGQQIAEFFKLACDAVIK